MRAFTRITGIAAPLLRANVDTDAIIPSREMKQVSKKGLAEGLFAGWRYRSPESREPDPEFVLNRQPFDRAVILLAGRNFGCGSSREHAVWALLEWGIRVIIALSFGAIFRANCIRNGLLPVILDESDVEALTERVLQDPEGTPVTVDLVSCRVSARDIEIRFQVPPRDRQMLLEGLDPVEATLRHLPEIEAFEAADRGLRPWVQL